MDLVFFQPAHCVRYFLFRSPQPYLFRLPPPSDTFVGHIYSHSVTELWTSVGYAWLICMSFWWWWAHSGLVYKFTLLALSVKEAFVLFHPSASLPFANMYPIKTVEPGIIYCVSACRTVYINVCDWLYRNFQDKNEVMAPPPVCVCVYMSEEILTESVAGLCYVWPGVEVGRNGMCYRHSVCIFEPTRFPFCIII